MKNQTEKLITIQKEKLKTGSYRIHEFEDGKETETYFAKCEAKKGLTLIDMRACLNIGETFSYGEGPAHHSYVDRVFYADKLGRLQGEYAYIFHSTLNGNRIHSILYKNGTKQAENRSKQPIGKGLKGISNRLAKLFFWKTQKASVGNIRRKGGRE